MFPREDYRISSLNCGGEDFAVACMRANLRYEKNQRTKMKTIEIVGENYCGNWDKTRTACRGIVIDGDRILLSYAAKTNLGNGLCPCPAHAVFRWNTRCSEPAPGPLSSLKKTFTEYSDFCTDYKLIIE